MVTVMVALAIGHRLSPMIFHVLRGTACCWAPALPLASALRYFCEMVDRVPSALSSSSALLMSPVIPLFFLAAKACSLVSPVLAAIFTLLSPVSAK